MKATKTEVHRRVATARDRLHFTPAPCSAASPELSKKSGWVCNKKTRLKS